MAPSAVLAMYHYLEQLYESNGSNDNKTRAKNEIWFTLEQTAKVIIAFQRLAQIWCNFSRIQQHVLEDNKAKNKHICLR